MPGGRSGSECALDRRIEPDRRVSPAFTLPPGACATTVLGEPFPLDRFR